MASKKTEAVAGRASEPTEAPTTEAVADAGHLQAEARRTKGFIGSAPGEDVDDTVAAVTEKG